MVHTSVDLMRDDELLTMGNWDLRYAKVLVTAACDDRGIALIDTNGDGRMIEFTQYWRDDVGHWEEGTSSGPEPNYEGFEAQGDVPPDDGYHYSYGRTAPHGHVTVQLAGREVRVQATDSGWWAVVARPGD